MVMRKYFVVMILLVGVQSCKIDSTDEYEMKVFVEIFDDLIKEMDILNEQEIPPLPFISAFNNNNAIGYDTAEHKKKLDGITNLNRRVPLRKMPQYRPDPVIAP